MFMNIMSNQKNAEVDVSTSEFFEHERSTTTCSKASLCIFRLVFGARINASQVMNPTIGANVARKNDSLQ
jgi:hypothetical protein